MTRNPSAGRTGRVEVVHSLRGIAALAVAFYHFTCGNPSFYVPPMLRFTKGWAGVEVFFVISGFILPYSLWRAGYSLSRQNFTRFIWKRIVRLDPPYFVTIGLVLLLGYFSARAPGFKGTPFHIHWAQLAMHLGYLNAFTGSHWLNPAFWTLAVECQFYLLIAGIFPLVASRNRTHRLLTVASLLMVALLVPRTEHFVTDFLALFVVGICTFQWFAGLSTKWETALVFLPVAAVLFQSMGSFITVVGLAAALLIFVAPSWTNAPLAFFGTLSYSLYLLHVPVGGRVINLFQRLPPSATVAVIGIFAAAVVSTGAAWLLYRFVESPAQRYAGSLRFEARPASHETLLAECALAQESSL